MAAKEATARIKINRHLDEAEWRFFDNNIGPANIVLESNVKISAKDTDALGVDFERVSKGFVDFLLLDSSGKPLIILEAKAEDKHPLVGKEQARKYARSQNARFVILSNGKIHFLWDLEQGNPNVISKFPTPGEIGNYYAFEPNADRLVDGIQRLVPAFHRGDDVVWIGCPSEGLGLHVVLGEEAVDGGLEVEDGVEDAAL